MTTANLEYWCVIDRGEYHCLCGRIYDDKMNRFRDGDVIYTTKIIYVDIENLTVKTRNSTYKLGNPSDDQQIAALKNITLSGVLPTS